jgi:hypothetical protein
MTSAAKIILATFLPKSNYGCPLHLAYRYSNSVICSVLWVIVQGKFPIAIAIGNKRKTF